MSIFLRAANVVHSLSRAGVLEYNILRVYDILL